MSQTVVVPIREIALWLKDIPSEEHTVFFMLFGGDRATCCEEAVVIYREGKIVAAASISHLGEDISGNPAIVGLYTLPSHRRQGLAREVLLGAINHCREKGFERVRVDVLSSKAMHLIESLNEEDRGYLDIHYQGPAIDLLEN